MSARNLQLEALAEKLHHAAAGATVGWTPWAELSQLRRDEWVLVAETAIAEVRKIPIPMRLPCEKCGALHVDEKLAEQSHHTHACQHCGAVWRPAIVPTVGVQFLPGCKDNAMGMKKLGASIATDEHWFAKILALAPGDACEYRDGPGLPWRAAIVIHNGGPLMSGSPPGPHGDWIVSLAKIETPVHEICPARVDMIRLPGQQEAWR